MEVKSSNDSNTQPSGQQNKVGRPKSTEKRDSIISAAIDLFLHQGFTATSMDNVANKAGVSKQTVYSHFSNKEALFTAVIGIKCREYQLDGQSMNTEQQTIEEVLFQTGSQFVRLLQDPKAIAMYRVVIGESTSNPRVAELFYQAGPMQGAEVLSDYLGNNKALNLTKEQGKYWSMTFYNLLKGDFHMCSLLAMPYLMSEQEIVKHVWLAVTNIMILMSNHDVQV